MNIHASRGRACGRSVSPWASSSCSSGSSSRGWIVVLGAVVTVVFGVLWVRDVAPLRAASTRPARSSRSAATSRGSAASGSGRAAEPSRTRPELPAREVPRGDTLGLGAVIGGADQRAGARLHGPAGVPRPGPRRPRPRPARPLPRGRVEDRHVPDRARGRRRLEGHRSSSATTACSSGSRASRSSRATACTSAARCSRTALPEDEPSQYERRDADRDRRRRASAARATAGSTTTRATAPPARPSARSTGCSFSIRNGNLFVGDAFSVVEGRGHRRATRGSTSGRLRLSRASTSTAPSPGSTRSSRPS